MTLKTSTTPCTVTSTCRLSPPKDAVTVAVPGATRVKPPLTSDLRTPSFDDVHVAFLISTA